MSAFGQLVGPGIPDPEHLNDWKEWVRDLGQLWPTAIPAQLTPEQIIALLGRLWINVTAPPYNATGDGSTDDSTAFQAAIDSITLGQAGTILVPTGIYKLTTPPAANGRFPTFFFLGGSSVVGTFTLPYLQYYSNGINFDNGAFRVGSNDAFSGGGAFVIGGADMRENGNGSYLANDGHPDWNALQSTIAFNPTEFNIYGNGTGGIASANGTTITRVTGSSFTSQMVGKRFFYNGTLYTVDTVTNGNALELTSGAGVSANKTWHFVYTTGSGTCNVVGATVTRVTGEPLMPFITETGFVFKIAGVARTVSAYNSDGTYTLAAAPGNVTGAAFTFEVSINDQIATTRIQKLSGVSEENLSIFAKPSGYYLAALASGSGTKWPVYLCSDTTGGAVQPVAELPGVGKFFALGGTQTDAAARFNWTASQVNYFDGYGAVAGLAPTLRARGTDTNIGLGFDTKGVGSQTFTSHSFANTEFQIFGVGGSSWLAVGSSASAAPILSANGAAADIDIRLAPKGAGVVWVGAWTANADAPITGYVTSKDTATGNVIKLATIA